MKKFSLVILFIVLVSCNSTKKPMESRALYDVLFADDFSGGSFQFYEIVSEENEFKMLLADEMIKQYIKKDDIKTSNFILLNLGEKPSGGYGIKIEKVKEYKDKIEVTIKETAPKGMATSVITKPRYIIKVKSKKPIEIK